MKDKQIESFKGFSKDTIEFLMNLRYNNNKSWFEEHRQDYYAYVLDPFKSLAAELAPLYHYLWDIKLEEVGK